MKKIIFIICSLIVAASCCNEAPKKDVCLQLYSVRKVLMPYEENHEAIFNAIAEMGYTTVEACSYSDGKFYGRTAEEFKADLEAAGLKAISCHAMIGLEDEMIAAGDFSARIPWWEQLIATAKAIGMKYIVIPSIKLPTENVEATYKVYADYFNAVGKLCSESGIKLGYHNHSREFEKREDIVFEDYMLEHTNPEYVFFQMDLYWAVQGHVSPTAYFAKYPGRFAMFHVKDYREVGQGGCVGFDAIFNKAEQAGAEAIVVECEGSSYDDILRTCKESVDYLNNAEFVKF